MVTNRLRFRYGVRDPDCRQAGPARHKFAPNAQIYKAPPFNSPRKTRRRLSPLHKFKTHLKKAGFEFVEMGRVELPCGEEF